MPVYEYKCKKCGAVSEESRRLDERDNPLKCPECGFATERIMSGFASKIGFYIRPPAKPSR